MPSMLAERPDTAGTAPLFLGLQSYTEEQAAQFFGRNDEISRLTNLIKANTLTLVFGKSGIGKTSLLNAGVFPRLRKDYCLPFRIRLNFTDDSPDLVAQIKATLTAEINKYGFQVESYPGDETLWEYFHREQLWRSVTPILIFDQFEEIFTLTKRSSRFTRTDVDAFWDVLSDLVENAIPDSLKEKFLNDEASSSYSYKVSKIKVVFSFREEFLPEFEGVTARIPSLKYSRFRLLPMNGHQAHEVVTKNWGHHISDAESHQVVSFFKSEDLPEKTYDLMAIEPSLLSQVCALIEKERRRERHANISAQFFARYSREVILRQIYDEAMAESNKALAVTVAGARPVNEFVEDKLITDEGYRSRYALQPADEQLAPGLALLKTKYFLREEGKNIELTHDVLTPMIKADREERRREAALVLARKKAKRRVVLISVAALVVAAGIWYFTANKAIHDRDVARTEKQQLDLQILSAATALDSISQSLDTKRDSLNRLAKDKPKVLGIATIDTAAYQRLLLQIQRDSLALAAAARQYAGLRTLQRDWEIKDSLQTSRLLGLQQQQRQNDSALRQVRMEMSLLQRRHGRDSSSLALLRKNYNELSQQYQAAFLENGEAVIPAAQSLPFDTAADTASLRLQLKQGVAKGPAAKDLKVYLIPYSAENLSVIKQAADYEIRCNDTNLEKATGYRVARYHQGNYVFLNVPPGKYFVKICTYYGGYYTLTKSRPGNVEFTVDASPPIR